MSKKYNKYTKDELIHLLIKRDAERKLGLVWERDEIEHERALNDDFVVLEMVDELSVGDGAFRNLLIEGDNFDALRYLNMAFKGRVKCIYIDPPYNTENADLIYNDKRVGADDDYRHSKWLEHLYQRIVIARDLLTVDGVMLVSINDENCAKLDLLLEQLMPNKRLGSFVWRTKDTGNDKGGNLSQVHEHVLVYANPRFEFTGKPINTKQYTNSDNDPEGPWRSQPITKAHSYTERENTYYPIQDPKTGLWYPCDPDRVWAYASLKRIDELEKAGKLKKGGKKLRSDPIEVLIEKEEIYFPPCKPSEIMQWDTKEELVAAIRNGEGPVLPQKKTPLLREGLPDLDFWVGKPISPNRPSRKHYLKRKGKLTAPVTSWIAGINEQVEFDDVFDDEIFVSRSPRGREGSDAIKEIMGSKAFDFPKPPSLIKHLIQQSTSGNDIVMDFYAGSGTTGHATLLINNEDDKKRRFILVSDTEATDDEPEKNVCRDVASVRLSRVIEGYNKTNGLEGDFCYMRAVRTPIELLHDKIQHSQIWYALQLIHFDTISRYSESTPFQETSSNELRAVYLMDASATVLRELNKILSKSNLHTVIYAWRPAVVKQKCLHEHITVEQIPEYLIDKFSGKLQ